MNIGQVSRVLLLASVSMLPASLHAQEVVRSPEYKGAIEKAESAANEILTDQKIPGLAFAVAIDGKIVWSQGFGSADVEKNVPVTPGTRFRIGSISKLFTAAAAAKLSEGGYLDLDAPIWPYVPGYPQKQFAITSRELLGHLAGIRHYGRDDYINQRHYDSVSESLGKFSGSPLMHKPGTKYSYSSPGYTLLGAVIEGVAKTNFTHYLQTNVFQPIGMKNTVPDDNREIIENRSEFYSLTDGGRLQNAIYMDTSDRLPAGGFLSTAEDLAAFGTACALGDFFRPEMKKIVFTSQSTTEGKMTGVGFGWRIGKDSESRPIFHHGGDAIGGRAFLLIYPEEKIVLSFVSNLSFVKFNEKDAEKIAVLFTQ
ncbi:MAG: beta-lactamase family protein [Acidobacteriota bacterium]|nr:MAG: beta-lactamase family protein [Acidobacteriota bacterium]